MSVCVPKANPVNVKEPDTRHTNKPEALSPVAKIYSHFFLWLKTSPPHVDLWAQECASEQGRERERGKMDDIMHLASARRGDIYRLCVCLNKSLCERERERESVCVQLCNRATTSPPALFVRLWVGRATLFHRFWCEQREVQKVREGSPLEST